MAGGFSKIIVANVVINSAASAFQTYTNANVGAGNATAMSNAQYIPSGSYILPSTANVTVEINLGNATTAAWTTWYGANTAGWLESDGFNVRANATTGTQTITLYGINGGQAVTGTFTS